MFIGGGYYYFYIYTDEGISLIDGDQEEEEEEDEQQEEFTVNQLFDDAEGNWVNPVFTSCQAPSKDTCSEKCLRQGFPSFSYDDTGTSTMNGSCRCLQDTNFSCVDDLDHSSYSVCSGYIIPNIFKILRIHFSPVFGPRIIEKNNKLNLKNCFS